MKKNLKFKTEDGRHLKKSFFGHNSAVDCPTSVKFCVGSSFFSQNFGNRTDVHVSQNVFCFLNAVWASASGTFRIVSDTLVLPLITLSASIVVIILIINAFDCP